MSAQPKQVSLTAQEAEALKQRVLSQSLSDTDQELLVGLISFNFWLQQQLATAKLTIRKLKGFFGFRKEKKSPSNTADVELSSEAHIASTEENSAGQAIAAQAASSNDTLTTPNKTSAPIAAKKKPVWSAQANHGRYGFDDYAGLDTVTIPCSGLETGSLCPHCQEGKLYTYEAGTLLRLVGQPLVTGTRYRLAGFRCNLCSQVYKPTVPDAVVKAPKFAPSAVSNIAISHYHLGLPFNRLEALQANYTIPLPDATQWDEMAKLSQKVSPVVSYLETLSANSTLMYYDNTPQKILSLGKGQATALVTSHGSYWIYLFYTGRHSAGNVVSGLLTQRTTEEALLTMTDAARANQLSNVDATLYARLIIAYCLVHGRRKFHELLDCFPDECQFVLECMADVYRHEAHCKQHHYTPVQRLSYHQQHSAPVMEALKMYLTHLWLYGSMEQNGALGDAVGYMLKRWQSLTQFLRVAGCPLDNSLCERAIKVLIRYRKNSLFYKTLQGALCGDTLMSLIHTAVRNNVNALEYLNTLQTYADAVALAPQDFLPWNYQATLADGSKQAA